MSQTSIIHNIPVLGLTTHKRQVQSLYKRALRNLESWIDRKDCYRYYATLLRARFDRNRHIKDPSTAKEVLRQGEEELWSKKHYDIKKFPGQAPNGVDYERVVLPPDWVLDHWHYLEKAQYPEYFERRERRKKEYVKLWEDLYANPKL